MKLKKTLKDWIFRFTHSPNSPAGLRHRAQKLIDEGVDPTNPYVTMLLKRAKFQEENQ